MRRSILTSFVLIGAVLALVVGGATFAVFTDTENINGTVSSAILDFELSGEGDTTGTNEAAEDEILTISFDNVGVLCGWTTFAPGDSCTIPVQITRPAATIAQQLAADLSITSVTFNGATTTPTPTSPVTADCAGNDNFWTLSWAFRDDGSANESRLPAATADGDQFLDVTVALASGATNACQNDTIGDIAFVIDAAQNVATPHDIAYD